MRLARLVLLVAALAYPTAGQAQIVGGSTLLTGADLAVLEGYLGEGPLQLTNIFTKTVGDGQTSLDFHAVADGVGRTFSIMQVLGGEGDPSAYPAIIGGYNPQSWHSLDFFNMTPDDSERTAFLFNLTTGVLQRQNLVSNGQLSGQFQTENRPISGPSFGGGYDLGVSSDLESGYTFNISYGGTQLVNILGNPNGNPLTDALYGTIEVFTIQPSAVPEPSTWAMLGLAALGGLYWRRRRAVP